MMNTVNHSRPHVVVLGAGFGGLTFCQTFRHSTARITVVDRQNHHLFQPLLYQVATAGLSAPEIAQPIRSILRNKPNVTVLLRNVTGFDLARREVQLGEDVLHYDYLVLALGSVTGYSTIQSGSRMRPDSSHWTTPCEFGVEFCWLLSERKTASIRPKENV